MNKVPAFMHPGIGRADGARLVCGRAGPAGHHELLRHLDRRRQGRRPRRPRGRRCALPAARASGGRRHQDLARYLSTQAAGGQGAVNARDRIGSGPWQNAKGAVVAKNVDELHSLTNNLTKQTALTEKGDVVKGPRRLAERARRPHRLDHGRPRLPARRGPHVQELDEQHPGHRDARPHRPGGHPGHRRGSLVECLAPLARS